MARSARRAPSSRSSIARLKAQGWSNARIGRAVGRDSSFISQIEKGRKPGNNLASSLDTIASGRRLRNAPPERRTKAGTRARVRRSKTHTSAKTDVRTFRGLQAYVERIAARDGRVILTTQWGETQEDTYFRQTPSGTYLVNPWKRKGNNGVGEDAKSLLAKLLAFEEKNRGKKDKELLAEFLKRHVSGGPGQVKVSDFQGVSISAVFGKRGS